MQGTKKFYTTSESYQLIGEMTCKDLLEKADNKDVGSIYIIEETGDQPVYVPLCLEWISAQPPEKKVLALHEKTKICWHFTNKNPWGRK